MNKFLLLAVGVLLVSCSKQDSLDLEMGTHSPYPKVMNSAEGAVAGEIIVRFTHEGAQQVANQGIALFEGLELLGVERVFKTTKKKDNKEVSSLDLWYLIRYNNHNADDVVRKLSAMQIVDIIEYNSILEKQSTGKTYSYKASTRTESNSSISPFQDTYVGDQWHFNNTGDTKYAQEAIAGADINLFDAWSMCAGDPSIVVAVVDEAVQYNHPDLADNMWVNKDEIPNNGIDDDNNGYVDDVYGYNFADTCQLTWDNKEQDEGHGTHIAGIISAVNNNGIGVSGIAGGTGKKDGVRLMSCQIFGDRIASAANVAKAIVYAADNGASILQCSFGNSRKTDITASDNAWVSKSPLEIEAYEYFLSKKNNSVLDGGLIIFAAGNECEDRASYPGAYRKFISVSSISGDYRPTWYTNYGIGVNITAPGGSSVIAPNNERYGMVLSTLISSLTEDGAEYGYKEGTSMACPHVVGVAALGLSYAKQLNKTFTVEEFKSMLLTSANDIDVYLEGNKITSQGTLTLPKYKKQMGTGLIDATQFCLQIEGAPMLKVKVNTNQYVSLNDFFGGSSGNMSYLSVEISEEDKAKLGITEAPSIKSGKLHIKCGKPGYARIKVKAIAGGDEVATPDHMGGMEVEKEIAIIARGVQTENDGWL